MSDLTVTINANDGTITFTWTYDDSTNSVPITGFVLTIIPVNGGTNITRTLLPTELSFEYSLNQLMAKVQYRVSVSARNTQGESELIFRPFTTPEGILHYLPPSLRYFSIDHSKGLQCVAVRNKINVKDLWTVHDKN